MTLDEIKKEVPLAAALVQEALIVGLSRPLCDNEPFFHSIIKPSVAKLVGTNAAVTTPERFWTAEAYDLLHRACLEAVNCYQVFIGMCGFASMRGYKQGWAWHQFKARFGVPPKFQLPAKMARAERWRRAA